MVSRNIIKLITEQYLELLGNFERMEIASKTTLLQEGEVSKHLFFIEQGALRAWTNKNGEEITVQFLFEGQVASAFMGREPSMASIQSIEPSIVLRIEIQQFEKILDQRPQFKDLMIEILLQRLMHYNSLFIARIKYSPQERYASLQANNPELLQRVPQHYIATYLGITSVSLSRIRNRNK